MPSHRSSDFSSAFDDMLERNQRELDALSGGSNLGPSRTTGSPAPTPATPRVEVPPTPTATSPAQVRTPAERALDRKLGPGWRYEVMERIREGAELVVRCRVTVPGRGITRTHYGSAAMSGRSAPVTGTAAGIKFGLDAGAAPAGTGAIQAEHDAERQAIESALSACARLL